MRQLFTLIFAIAISLTAFGQDTIPLYFSKKISEKNIKEDLIQLSSEKMEGRETGMRGQKLAAEYIYKEFLKANLKNRFQDTDSIGYFQNLSVFKIIQSKAEIKIGEKTFCNYEDFLLSGFDDYINPNLDVAFLGTAPDSSYLGKNFKDKAVLFLTPNLYAGALKSNDIVAETNAKIVLFCNPENPHQHQLIIKKQKSVFKGSYKLDPKKFPHEFRLDSIKHAHLYRKYKINRNTLQGPVSPELASEILQVKVKDLKKCMAGKILNKQTDASLPITLDFQMQYNELPTENVIAFLPGTDKKDEYIVISAHYDHVGKTESKIYYGANDNASGTAALLEIARKFQDASLQGFRPKRSILFIAFTGEEKGLLGSEYFVASSKIPMKSYVANLNLDMLGRKDSDHKDTDYIYLLGTNHLNPRLKSITDSINRIYPKLQLDYKYDQPDSFLYAASDQASFVRRNIPAIFYFNGLHKDYHKPTDTADKINCLSIKKVAGLVFLTAWNLAN